MRQYRMDGHLERDSQYVYAICDDALVAVHGTSEEDALGRIQEAAVVYVNGLRRLGWIGAAIKAGKIRAETGTGAGLSTAPTSLERLGSRFSLLVATPR